MRRPKSSPKRLGALPMTSMIDVVFLLLVFFLVTSNFAAPENRVDTALRAEGRSGSVEELQPQIIEVLLNSQKQPVFRIGENTVTAQQSLTALLQRLPSEGGVIVRGSDAVPVQAIADAMQAALDAGFDRRTYAPATP